jgi:hypothetical protein
MTRPWCILAVFWLTATVLFAQEDRPVADPAPLTDDQIVKLVYDRGYQTPPGFYRDPALTKPEYSLYFHQPGWFADDKEQARQIVQDFLDKPSNIAVRKIEEARESDHAFDFRGGTIWYRVHRPGWFAWAGKRVGEVRANPDGKPVELGRFAARPLTADAVRRLAEYEWLIHHDNLTGAKVLRSTGQEEKDAFVHTLLTTEVVYGDFGLRDEITVRAATYRVDKQTGRTTKTVTTVKQLTGKQN